MQNDKKVTNNKEAFSNAGAKLSGPTGTDCHEAILQERPDLEGQTAYFPEQGAVSHTIIIGEEVFKAPKIEHILKEEEACLSVHAEWRIESIEREIKTLRHLQGKDLPAPVPEVTYEGKETIFFGMTRMKGVKLDTAIIGQMTQPEKRQFAKDLAGFVSGFEKAVSAEEAKELKFLGDEFGGEHKPEAIQRALQKPSVVGALGDHFEFCRDMQNVFAKRYEEEYRNVPMRVSHGDLHFGNILCDPETKKISAIIDFGSCNFCRPEMNFIGVSNGCSDDLTSMICEEYSKNSDSKITLKDIRIYKINCLIVAVEAALEYKNEKWMQQSVEQIAVLRKALSDAPQGVSQPSHQKPSAEAPAPPTI